MKNLDFLMFNLYPYLANKKSKVYTLEGCQETANIAQENFDKMELKNIELTLGDFKNTLDYSLEDFRKTIDINIVGAFIVLKEISMAMKSQHPQGGSIVNTASMAGIGAPPNMIAYATSKAAIKHMTVVASKDLSPQYQIGYHKIFLPLVKKSKTNKIIKKILEHIAIHRTIDIRQEEKNKTHLLGRVYRTILEPICYWAGKK